MNGPCLQYVLPLQSAPGGIAVAHEYATVIAKEDLGMDLAAAQLIIEEDDWLVTLDVVSMGLHIRRVGGLSILLL
ncbi:hypothetical protein Rhsp01_49200 [Rhizobium sp. NBRC 114257]|uniref:Uncharacterized protein n=1 Tax=Rhizobium dioscoreae TaxID=2653122 RepID=A0ABQ0ZAW8_9HYPH|nr:hypothetical protein RsS93_50330 [Rhizobium dioscoreae]GLU83744.1 hypothetical protein Rhsp01_49200 [Rhizobium sp. NBRC 114257]